MSTARGRSMRSKVEARMKKESGKTMKEIRRAKIMKLKLMDDNERLVYNLKRAKKKVALLLQKLKKYELPELPASVHDPELFTPEQLQAYKKIGYKNKNYVPVGVRGVFGGVVQNMHMHWKFHETVQVCCDNFPKEKIKEMATMIARLSGGVVINIHNTKTIIMFRGRNYRQPKNLIPFNTLTKRKALFKARFEQALESQKLNIKKTEQELRKKGVNPEDPVAMASIQRVASTFFNAIDKKDGTPYVFQSDKLSVRKPHSNIEPPESDSDQEELDQFIAEIEGAADKEWAEEEAAEKEELGQIRYLNREDYGGRFRKSRNDDDKEDDMRGSRGWKDSRGGRRTFDHDDSGDDGGLESDGSDHEIDANRYSRKAHDGFKQHRGEWEKPRNIGRVNNDKGLDRSRKPNVRWNEDEDSESENMLNEVENAMWVSDDEDEDDYNKAENPTSDNEVTQANPRREKTRKEVDETWDSD
ncbi:CRM-domain containing factor CFM9, mitochondrial-like [Rutidosis leptorrhynchoides]|uniref:CRM-domain containing factor CFM9, mitochondrial-like n=1 Tax=Rutidosis leptorrhynchoides TaxID=125765 RepID=UPI003A9A616E